MPADPAEGILLVHEDPYVRVVLADDIGRAGYLVWATAHPAAALAWAHSNPFRVALVAARPSGFERDPLVARLRVQQPEMAVALLGAGGAPAPGYRVIDQDMRIAAILAHLRAVTVGAGGSAPAAEPPPAGARAEAATLGPGRPGQQALAHARSVFVRWRTRRSA